jgi:glycosyltransferase involved in cell wall biosynthesis
MAAIPDSSVFVIDPVEMKKYESLIGKIIVVVIPAHNEARFIGSVILSLDKYVSQVVVVDDGSTDNTPEIARAAGAKVLRHQKNMGKGVALTTGFQEAIKYKPDVVVMIDADGQHQANELPDLVTPVLERGVDLVIGSRYLRKKSEVPKHRVIGHRFFNMLTETTSGTVVTDSQSGYRAISPKALEIFTFSSDGFSVESEMQFIANENNLVVEEISVDIQYLDKPKRSIFRQGISVLLGILQLAGQYRPLVFIGIPSFLLFMTGFFWGIRVINMFLDTRLIPIGNAFGCAICLFIGITGISTSVILHSVRGLISEQLQKRR